MLLDYRVLSAVAPSLLMLVGLAYFVITDRYINKLHRKTMLITIALIATMIGHDILDDFLVNNHISRELRTVNCAYGYIVFPFLIIAVYYFVNGSKRYLPAWCLAGINAIVYIISIFKPIAFSIQPNHIFKRGPLGFTSHAVCVILLLGLLFLSIREYDSRKKRPFIPIVCLLLLIASMILDTLKPESDSTPISFVTMFGVICCVLFYLWINRQLVHDYEKSVLEQQRMRIMVSQIQPHFLYNTIATFKALCKSDPDKAAVVAEKFGQYLRKNLDSLSNDALIPVEKELDHTRVYAYIEMVRFENIRVEYDIADSSFSLPALTIQPIVENAIRHGVRIREEGIVRVSTRLSEGFHEVVISDNGVGFDVTKTDGGDGTHIGIENVRGRIEAMCGGTMTIESEPDKGTTVTIRIPQTEAGQ